MAKYCDDLLIFLGAGASMPGMLTTQDVTSKLRAWDAFREPPDSPTSPQGMVPLRPSLSVADSRPPFFEVLQSSIAPWLHEQSFLNFERMMHVVEELAQILPIPAVKTKGDKFKFLPASFLSIDPVFKKWNIDSSNYWIVAVEAAYQILTWFTEQCDLISSPKHPLATGLKNLADSGKILHCFSLNYDDIAQQSGIDFYTGFNHLGRFMPEYSWPNRHSLCQLHGSVLFGKDGHDVIAFASRSDAAKARLTRSSARTFQDGHSDIDAPMITGLRKADKVLARPFGTYMHVFREALLQHPLWLIVGYGFGDDHINEAMLQAKNNWKQRGVDVRAVIVDWHSPRKGDFDAWRGTPCGEALLRVCEKVFVQDLNDYFGNINARLNANLLTPISNNLLVDFTGVDGAFNSHLAEIVKFLEI